MFGVAIAASRLSIDACSNCGNIIFSNIFKQFFTQGLLRVRLHKPQLGVRHFGGSRSFAPNSPWRWAKEIFRWNHFSRQILSIHPNILQHFKHVSYKEHIQQLKRTAANPLKISTNVKNNVMLYRYERPWMYKGATAFAILALVGCLTMAYNVYFILCKNLFNSEIPLKERLFNHALPVSAVVIGVVGGPLIMGAVFYLTLRTIKYVVLHKGGQDITLVTYHPFKNEVKMKVPLKNISSETSRDEQKPYIGLRIKNKKFKYVVDKTGTFVNPELFDVTVAVKRTRD